jgi:hypothetical protein
MTTGCVCARCRLGIVPQADQVCRWCEIEAMPPGPARYLASKWEKFLNGERPLVPGCLQPAPQQRKELEKQSRRKLPSADRQIELEL